MAFEDQEQFLQCPYCNFLSYDFSKLEGHCRIAHVSAQEEHVGLHTGPVSSINRTTLNDYELAQLLAFEEAGLPPELALQGLSHDPRRRDEEGTAASSPLPSRTHPHDKDDKDQAWVECVCGERVHVLELDAHADMHAQEDVSGVDIHLPAEPHQNRSSSIKSTVDSLTHPFSTSISRSIRNYDQILPKHSPTTSRRRIPSLKEILLGSSASPKSKASHDAVSSKQGKTRRLGRAELGPFAHERQMPTWLYQMIEEGARVTITNRIGPDGTLVRVETIANETPNLVPVLARLSQLDRTVERAFYCSPDVHHVAKMPREGGFCGYRNIQMMVSYIRDSETTGFARFKGRRLPGILKIQDLIEQAWDMGFNSSGRDETGGIKATRKYIGTPEAQALFLSLDIPCEATGYLTVDSAAAKETMLCAVCDYFDNDRTQDNVDKVVITDQAPIYFQHPGHSMTIVGVESRTDGSVNLVVYDPIFNPNQVLKRLASEKARAFRCNEPERLLKAHRRGDKYLSNYRAFELLKLTSSTPSSEDA